MAKSLLSQSRTPRSSGSTVRINKIIRAGRDRWLLGNSRADKRTAAPSVLTEGDWLRQGQGITSKPVGSGNWISSGKAQPSGPQLPNPPKPTTFA